MPVVDFDFEVSKRAWKEKRLVDGISNILKDTLNINPEDVCCIFRETPAHNHYNCGDPLLDWVPAEK